MLIAALTAAKHAGIFGLSIFDQASTAGPQNTFVAGCHENLIGGVGFLILRGLDHNVCGVVQRAGIGDDFSQVKLG